MKGVFIPEISVEMLKNASLDTIEDFFSRILNDGDVAIWDAELPRWIPTSKTETIPDHEVLCCDRYENQMIGYLTNDHGEWICEFDSEVMDDTIAWMPLPDPWKGEQDEVD